MELQPVLGISNMKLQYLTRGLVYSHQSYMLSSHFASLIYPVYPSYYQTDLLRIEDMRTIVAKAWVSVCILPEKVVMY